MTNAFEVSKNQLVEQLEGTIPQLRQSGIGSVVDVTKLRQIDTDLSIAPYLEEGTKVYTDDKGYFIVSSDDVLLYAGAIDAADGDETVAKDLTEFPRLTEVTVALGKGDMKTVSNLLNDPVYFMAYSSEMLNGMMKAHDNGHIDLEAELTKALS